MYRPARDNREQLEALIGKITEKRAQLEQQLTDIRILQGELDDAEARARQAMENLENDHV
ncbi:hypothetical protein ASALC70_04377 [Alcanivorax sp. ALC70]|nr:hypothetical protein ASALC70_04377 [Alcanivorax sp. ALC70]